MTDTISVSGLVATTPRHVVTPDGLPITSFRLASAQRRFDRGQQRWIDAETNWFTVTAFRQLAINSSQSVSKGDRVVISGRLRVRDWDNGERSGTSVEIEADGLGHDLSWGTSQFVRTVLVRDSDEAQNPQAPDHDEAASVDETDLNAEIDAFAQPDSPATKAKKLQSA
jgi:single-strand DNA-binding protein